MLVFCYLFKHKINIPIKFFICSIIIQPQWHSYIIFFIFEFKKKKMFLMFYVLCRLCSQKMLPLLQYDKIFLKQNLMLLQLWKKILNLTQFYIVCFESSFFSLYVSAFYQPCSHLLLAIVFNFCFVAVVFVKNVSHVVVIYNSYQGFLCGIKSWNTNVVKYSLTH